MFLFVGNSGQADPQNEAPINNNEEPDHQLLTSDKIKKIKVAELKEEPKKRNYLYVGRKDSLIQKFIEIKNSQDDEAGLGNQGAMENEKYGTPVLLYDEAIKKLKVLELSDKERSLDC